jgi:hypothetical protein
MFSSLDKVDGSSSAVRHLRSHGKHGIRKPALSLLPSYHTYTNVAEEELYSRT